MARRLPPTVIALGFVSLLTDLSSEMIYPLLPIFLTEVLGAGAVALGLIEGVAESTAAVLKLLSGVWSDRVTRRKPFVLVGYGLSGLVRPLIGLAGAWPVVLVLRFSDRIGKGLRGAPRDALIADVIEPGQRGAAFGWHRSMDHLGAVLGPLAAALLMSAFGLELRWVFLAAVVPAIAVVVVILRGVREPQRSPDDGAARAGSRASWRRFDWRFRRLLLAVVVFGLGNSTDAFLLLALTAAGVPAPWVAALWSAHHMVKMVATNVGGRLSDRVGRRPMLLAGWALYAVVYLAFAVTTSAAGVIALFLVYGVYFGLTEPVEKALVADLAPAELRGAAFGLLHGAVALAALPASLVFGLLWSRFGSGVAFTVGAILAAVAAAILSTLPETSHQPSAT